jgi:hypothetical protein
MARDYLCGEMAGFRCDIAALRTYYEQEIRPTPSQPYFDNGANYVGWAITSRDGSTHDGIQHIKRSTSNVNTARSMVQPTALCRGPMKDVMDQLVATRLEPFRARVMSLADHDFSMTFHKDAERETWRLHVPIITNPAAFFEWQIDGTVVREHLPADGRAFFVRVDQTHRAVNEGTGHGERVHLLMSLVQTPAPRRFGPDSRLLPGVVPQPASA